MSGSSFWFCLPIIVFFLFHHNILSYLGINMSSVRGGRGGLVQQLTTKMERDRELEQFDKTCWYSVDQSQLSETLKNKFVQLDPDDETLVFINQSVTQSDYLFTQLWYNVAKTFLSIFYCQTDINGMLRRGSMFVFSRDQFLKMSGLEGETRLGSMLDLGAGDGRPTQSMSSFYEKVFTTEMSAPMRRNLAAKGFEVLEIDNWVKNEEYDLISALNLFDRCDKPLSIISDIHKSLKQSGLFVVALVLPFRPYVESVPGHRPSEKMNIAGELFENQVESAVDRFESVGFSLRSWSRVPYLCEGDLARPLYQLNNVLLVFNKI